MICMRVTKARGQVVAVLECLDGDSIIVATESGKMVRTGAEELRSMGRSGQGVRLVKLHEGDKVAGVDLIRE